MTGVESGHTVGPYPFDQRVGRVIGIDGAQLGLDGRCPVQLILIANLPDVAVQGTRETDDGMRIHESGRNDGRFEHFDAGGNVGLGRRT